MSKKYLKNNEDSKKLEDLKLKEISKHQNSGVISFTKEEDKKSLAVNPVRFLLPLDYSKAHLKEDNLEIDLKEKEKPDDKGFEIIMEINPNIYEDKKKKSKRKSNLPMLYNQEEVKEETLGVIDDYRELFSRQMKLALSFSEIYINSIADMQKSFLEEYFNFLDSLSKK
ncbi:hypothetical protein [Peptoniphilus sp.]|uniref:hypothetical protein n=1 Tax=Peptoniphilus sp. TaxID=1971214 RepID=UPI002A80F5F2|nr:hypothetical protein [Peptoniphilus sp.]MDY3903201.1 hypothetical protein [Peptoniphilus sp.]